MKTTRRHFLYSLPAGLAWPALAADDNLPALLRQGGVAVLLRHAQTDPGVGDPENFRLGDCSTQRNLSEAGRVQARQLGAWFQSRDIRPQAVRSSAWCRCIDTAQLAFGQVTPWQPLNSFFGVQGAAEAQTAALRAALARLRPGQLEVWVTHQVNITALTEASASMGEAVVVDSQGRIRARTAFR